MRYTYTIFLKGKFFKKYYSAKAMEAAVARIYQDKTIKDGDIKCTFGIEE